jgi:DNA-binding NarL/FixJ family response regulator
MLVDDHPLWRDMVRRVLERRGLARVVAEASDGEHALEEARRERPEVVVMDIDLPGMDGVEATKQLLAEHPGTKVLVLSASDEQSQVMAAVKAGASGYLLKTAGSSEIADAVRRVHSGELVFPPSLAAVVLDELRRGGSQPGGAGEVDNAFVREGDLWTMAFGGEVTRMRDSKGLRAIAYLIAQAGEEVHVSAVAQAQEGRPPSRARRKSRQLSEEGLHTGTAGGAGPVLDQAAKAAYRKRIRELEAEVEEAESWNDIDRTSRAREEMDVLVRELSAAVGLGGRDRKGTSDVERARVNVTKRIKAAIERINQVHPGLARHLSVSVRTGTFCSYDPAEATPWVV